jgi:hypothetical protein
MLLGQVKLPVWTLDHDSPGSEIANSKAYMMLGQASGVGSGPVFELKLYSPPKREESFEFTAQSVVLLPKIPF